MDITKIINERLIKLDLKARTKAEAIEELVDLLAKEGAISSKEEFIKDVYLREEEGQTGEPRSDPSWQIGGGPQDLPHHRANRAPT